jgi:hypothetical protein
MHREKRLEVRQIEKLINKAYNLFLFDSLIF